MSGSGFTSAKGDAGDRRVTSIGFARPGVSTMEEAMRAASRSALNAISSEKA